MPKFISDEEMNNLEQQGVAKPSAAADIPLVYAPDELDMRQRAKDISPLESAGSGAVQGLSLGGSDEIGGALDTAKGVMSGEVPLDRNAVLKKYLQSAKDREIQNKAGAFANPKSYTAGEIGGGVATAFVPGLGVANGASKAATLAKIATVGAATGFGMSENRAAENPMGLAEDTALGGATGYLGGKALQKAGELPIVQKGVQKVKDVAGAVPEFLRKVQGDSALRTVGTKQNIQKSMSNMPGDLVGDVKKTLIDDKLAVFGATPEKVLDKTTAKLKESGKELSEFYKGLDKTIEETFYVPGKRSETGKMRAEFRVDGKKVAQRIQDEVIGPMSRKSGTKKIADAPGLADIVNDIRSKGVMTISNANAQKNSFQKAYASGTPEHLIPYSKEIERKIYDIYNQEIEQSVQNVLASREFGDLSQKGLEISPERVGKVKKAFDEWHDKKTRHRALTYIERMAEDAQNTKQGNRFITPSGNIGAAAGGIAGAVTGAGPVVGAALGYGANEALRRAGPGAVTSMTGAAAKGLESTGNKISSQVPVAVNEQLRQYLLNKNRGNK